MIHYAIITHTHQKRSNTYTFLAKVAYRDDGFPYQTPIATLEGTMTNLSVGETYGFAYINPSSPHYSKEPNSVVEQTFTNETYVLHEFAEYLI